MARGVDAPSRIVTAKRGRKSAKDSKVEKATILGLLTTAVSSVYGAVAIFAGEHWMLEQVESQLVATRLNDALETLPGKYYVFIKSYTENVAPWIALALAVYAVTEPRIQLQIQLSRERAAARQADRAAAADLNGDGGRQEHGEYDPRFAYPIVGEHAP